MTELGAQVSKYYATGLLATNLKDANLGAATMSWFTRSVCVSLCLCLGGADWWRQLDTK